MAVVLELVLQGGHEIRLRTQIPGLNFRSAQLCHQVLQSPGSRLGQKVVIANLPFQDRDPPAGGEPFLLQIAELLFLLDQSLFRSGLVGQQGGEVLVHLDEAGGDLVPIALRPFQPVGRGPDLGLGCPQPGAQRAGGALRFVEPALQRRVFPVQVGELSTGLVQFLLQGLAFFLQSGHLLIGPTGLGSPEPGLTQIEQPEQDDTAQGTAQNVHHGEVESGRNMMMGFHDCRGEDQP